jgi:hypothetical protein
LITTNHPFKSGDVTLVLSLAAQSLIPYSLDGSPTECLNINNKKRTQ